MRLPLPLSLLIGCISLVIASLSAPLSAQPAGAMGEHFIYLVEPNDTLSDLSELYTARSEHWRELQGLNQVSDELHLPIAKALKIPFSMIPVVATEATIVHTKGSVWVNESPPEKEQKLKTGDVIRTGLDGFLTLQLEDQSTLTLPNQSQLYIKQLNAFERSQLTDAILELQAGSVESHVAPNANGVGRFEIHTPMSITGVRGTSLRVHTEDQSTRTELITGQAHFDTAQAQYHNLHATQGVNITADGSYAISPLLPAPALTEPLRGRLGWQTTISPVTDAEYYLVQIALAPDGSSLVQRFEISAQEELTIPLRPSGPGLHYAFIRAVDENGLMGIDASLAFPGQGVLISRNSAPVLSTDGQAILLNSY